MKTAESVYVAIDVETTGLDPSKDIIIEIGAVKFRGKTALDTFQTFLELRRPLPYRIQRLTHITNEMLMNAPKLSAVAGSVSSFIGSSVLVGHSVGFDASFLKKANLIQANALLDTYDLASILLPSLQKYSLENVAEYLNVHTNVHHRALEDAELAMKVFWSFQDMIAQMPDMLLESICAKAPQKLVPSMELLNTELYLRRQKNKQNGFISAKGNDTILSRLGISPEMLTSNIIKQQNTGPEMITPSQEPPTREPHKGTSEYIAQALKQSKHAIIEHAPGARGEEDVAAALLQWAAQTKRKVVLAASSAQAAAECAGTTIPNAVKILGQTLSEPLKIASVYETTEYMCLHRWFGLARAASAISPESAKGSAKITQWLQNTVSGVRNELSLNQFEQIIWDLTSADTQNIATPQCAYRDKNICFVRQAYSAAQQADVIITTHAALLTAEKNTAMRFPADAVYCFLDTGKLEDSAFNRFTTTICEKDITDILNLLWNSADSSIGILAEAHNHITGIDTTVWKQQTVNAGAANSEFFRKAATAIAESSKAKENEKESFAGSLLINPATAEEPEWQQLQGDWGALKKRLNTLCASLETAAQHMRAQHNILLETELLAQKTRLTNIRSQLAEFMAEQKPDMVYWVKMQSQTSKDAIPYESPIVYSAPKSVRPQLTAMFRRMNSAIIFAGSSLSINQKFDFIRERTGLPEIMETYIAEENYSDQTLILLIHENTMAQSNKTAVTETITTIADTLRGNVLIMFPSYSALRTAYYNIKPGVEKKDIMALAQGIDGSQKQLWNIFSEQDRVMLFSAGSAWDSFDSQTIAPKCIIISRMPMPPLSEPTMAARAEQYASKISEFAAPYAALRVRRMLNKLAWSHSTRNVVVIFDNRISNTEQGDMLLGALPQAQTEETQITNCPDRVRKWLLE